MRACAALSVRERNKRGAIGRMYVQYCTVRMKNTGEAGNVNGSKRTNK